MHLGEFPHYRKPESEPAVLARHQPVGLTKRVEDLW
jgi:hypothetical protein